MGTPSKGQSHIRANNNDFLQKNSNKFDFYRKILVYFKYLLYLCAQFGDVRAYVVDVRASI